MLRRPAFTVMYGSGRSKYRFRGFLLPDALAGGGIIKVRYCNVADIRLWQIINFFYLKIISKICGIFLSYV